MGKSVALRLAFLFAVAPSFAGSQIAPAPRRWEAWQFPSSTGLPSVNFQHIDRTLELPVPEVLPRIAVERSPFVRLWGGIVDRVTSGIEGKQESSGGLRQKVTLYTITREENGTTRRGIARNLEMISRHPHIPDFFQRRLFLERKDEKGSVHVEIDENGELVSGPRDGFEQEFAWWQERISAGR